MGGPLLAGTATTLFSALALSTCTFGVLAKIGIFMGFTAGWSYLLATTLLPALLSSCGPASTRPAAPAPAPVSSKPATRRFGSEEVTTTIAEAPTPAVQMTQLQAGETAEVAQDVAVEQRL